jgi:ABC-2 type transport system permease protein
MIPLLLKRMIRIAGFVGKEVREIARQPRLLLSLMLGPFLILMIFGAGYLGPSPKLRGIIVLPNDPNFQSQKAALTKQFGTGMDVVDVTSDLGGG